MTLNSNTYVDAPSNCPRGRAASVRFDSNAPRLVEAKRQLQKPAPSHEEVRGCVLETLESLGINSQCFTVDTKNIPTDKDGYYVFDAYSVLGDAAPYPIVNITYAQNEDGIWPLCVALGTDDLNEIYPSDMNDYTKTVKYKNRYTRKFEEVYCFPTKGLIAHYLNLSFIKSIDLFPLVGVDGIGLTPSQVECCVGESLIAANYPVLDRWSHCY